MIKLLHRALAHLFDVCKKINAVGLKGQGFSQTLQDVFLAVVDLLNIKIFQLRHILMKRILGFKM